MARAEIERPGGSGRFEGLESPAFGSGIRPTFHPSSDLQKPSEKGTLLNMTTSTDIIATEPRIGIRNKVLSADWLIRTDEDGTEQIASITVAHLGRPRYAFSATLRRETQKKENGFTVRGMFPFDGVRLPMRGDVKRYSEKAARAYLADCIEIVRDLARKDIASAEVLQIFGEGE